VTSVFTGKFTLPVLPKPFQAKTLSVPNLLRRTSVKVWPAIGEAMETDIPDRELGNAIQSVRLLLPRIPDMADAEVFLALINT